MRILKSTHLSKMNFFTQNKNWNEK
jgi:hypothetical protein